MAHSAMNLLSAIAGIASLVHLTHCNPCYDYQTVPSLLPAPKYFTLTREAGLQIFTNSLQIPCDGYLIAWKFVPPNSQVNGLHLAVFRPNPDSYVNGIARNFTVVGETRIDGLSISNKQQWTTIRLPDSIPVMEGDSLGLFYDDYRTESDQIGVGVANTDDTAGSHSAVSGFGPASTLVLISDASQVSTGSIVDASSAPLQGRLAGLAGVLHSQGTNSTRCLVPLVPSDVTCNAKLINRYSFQNGNCKLFHGCPRAADAPQRGNNFDTVTECMRNCARLLPENQRAAVDSNTARFVDEAGQPPTEAPTTTMEPTTTLPDGWNQRCSRYLGNSDWATCAPPKPKRYTFNVYLGFCVSFSGCDPGDDQTGNNWPDRETCEANCAFNRKYLDQRRQNGQ